MKLGQTLKKLRKTQKLTQEYTAYATGITQTYLSQIETDKKEPSLSVLNSLATFYSVPLPVIMFAALEVSDIVSDKQEAFTAIKAPIMDLIKTAFPV